ncbi:MAG: hypothetical protein IPH75_11005 [bacterium]|nr:hypothetical protein [bacterium]
MSRFALTTCVAGFIACLVCSSIVAGTVDDGWTELHKLNTGVAKELFVEAIKENPKDESAKRGLMLASSLDLDHAGAVKAIKLMGSAPGDPYLPAVFEWWAALEQEWTDHIEVKRKIISLIAKSPLGGHQYMAEQMIESTDLETAFKATPRKRNDGFIGGWAIGPFDNKSNIAFFRDLPIEKQPLDTSVTVSGAMGANAGWCWLDPSNDGHLDPTFPFSNALSNVYVTKLFFEMPNDAEILILPGGIYSSRVRLDGTLIQTDPTHRNAYIRNGFRTSVKRGLHELTFSLGNNELAANMRLSIRKADYSPVNGLKWLRFANVAVDSTVQATQFHPLFDMFDSLTANSTSTEKRFWRGVLQLYNGYVNEAVTEYEARLAAGELSPLETYLLVVMLQTQENDARLNEVLGMIAHGTNCPAVAHLWIQRSVGTPAEQVDAMAKLGQQYPDRIEIEAFAAVGMLLTGDVQAYKQALDALVMKYPASAMPALLLMQFNESISQDIVSALKEYETYSRKTLKGTQYLVTAPQYYMTMQKYAEAIAGAREMLKASPTASLAYDLMVDAAMAAHTPAEVLPDLLAVAKRCPYRIILYDQLHRIYRQMGDEAKAREALLKIHAIKSSAPTPYMSLAELRNNTTLDSLFGTLNVDSLWQDNPTSEQLGGKNSWMLLDRTQKLVYANGPICREVHTVRVLEDLEAVQSFQEVENPVDESSTFETLLSARRLRKGQPPLNGEKNNGNILFKDLRAGDAIELRYRQWFNNRGDLWNEFSDNYECNFSLYQRHWEYAILTDRTDLVTRSLPPAPEAVVTEHCGFTRLSWSADHAEAYHLGLAKLPPRGDLVGRVVVSSIPNWQKLNGWYYSVSEAVLDDNPRAKEKARELTAGLTSPREKARALYRFVSLEIPYQTISFNYDASIPQKPDEVLVRRWGDCKDKAHLFIAMAREAGIDAWPVLVLTSSDQTTLPLPQFDFDHLIAACALDGDTQYVDLTATYYPFERTVTSSIADQPCLPVSASTKAELQRMPPLRSEEIRLVDTMEVWLTDQPQSRFELRLHYEDQSAGYRRGTVYGWTRESAREKLQTSASNAWKSAVLLDSVVQDSAHTIDSIYNERWWGNITLTQQQVSNMTLLTLPSWSPYSDGLFTSLYWNGVRKFPVSLRWEARNTNWGFKIHVPVSMGEPKMGDPITITGENWSFDHKSTWDKKNRVLTVGFALQIKPGEVDVATFAAFARKVKEAFDRPVIFSGN